MADADDIERVLLEILEQMSNIPLVGRGFEALERLTEAIVPLVKAVTDLASNLTSAATSGTSTPPHTPPPGSGGTGPPLPPGMPPAGGGTGGGSATAGAAGALSKVAAVGAVAAAAIGALVVAVKIAEEAFNKAREWVRLFNPGVITMFQFHLDNLGATIGRAFVPVFTMAIGVVRSFTAALAPIMSQLVPIMKEISERIGGLLLTYIRNITSLLRGMIPVLTVAIEVWTYLGQVILLAQSWFVMIARVLGLVIKVFMELTPFGLIIKIVAKAFEALNVIVGIVHEALDILTIFIVGIVDAIVEFVASFIPVEDVMNKLKEAVQFVIRNMYVFAVFLARVAGFNTVADNLIKHVEGKLKVGDTAAQTPQIKDLEQLSRDLALAAALAGGAASGVKVQDEREFWSKTLEEMKAARDNGTSVVNLLQRIEAAVLALNPLRGIGGIAAVPSGAKISAGGIPGVGAGVSAPGALLGTLGLGQLDLPPGT